MRKHKQHVPPTKRQLDTIDIALRVTFLILCLVMLSVAVAFGLARKSTTLSTTLQILFFVVATLCSLMGFVYGLFSWAKKRLIRKYKLEINEMEINELKRKV